MERRITEYLICRRDRYLTKSEVKQIKSELGQEIFNKYLRVEKLADYIYTIRFKKDTSEEEALVIIDYISNLNSYYKVYKRNKPYKQIKEEQQEVSKQKQLRYSKMRETKETGLNNQLAKAKECYIKRIEKAETPRLATQEA